jgi:hypothetical protein
MVMISSRVKVQRPFYRERTAVLQLGLIASRAQETPPNNSAANVPSPPAASAPPGEVVS